MARLAECLQDKREALDSSSHDFCLPVTFGGQCVDLQHCIRECEYSYTEGHSDPKVVGFLFYTPLEDRLYYVMSSVHPSDNILCPLHIFLTP